jgi:hypothetical protein
MTKRFLHIMLDFHDFLRNEPAVDDEIGKALDSYQCASNSWVVWTSSSPDKWYARLERFLEDGDRLFICELNIENRRGWMPRPFWNFIRSHAPVS